MRYLLFVFSLFWCSSQAQTYVTRIQHLDVHDGLSDNWVTGLVKMDDGILWVGTMDGLNRFDGFAFQEFNTLNSTLNSNVIKCLTRIGDTLVVVTRKSNSIQIATGLFIYTRSENVFIPFVDVYGPMPFSMEMIKKCKAYQNKIIFTLADGDAWYFDILQHSWVNIEKPDRAIFSFFYQGFVLYADTSNVYAVDIRHPGVRIPFPDSALLQVLWDRLGPALNARQANAAKSLETACYSPDRNLLWVPVNNQVFALNNRNALTAFRDGNRMMDFDREVRAIEIDDQHNTLYVGAEDGLYLILVEPVNFRTYFSSDSNSVYKLNKNYACRGIAVIGDTLYANTSHGTYRAALDQRSESPLPYDDRDRMFPMRVVGGDLVFGRNTLLRYHPSTGRLDTLVKSGIVNRLWSAFVRNGKYFLGSGDGVTVLDSALLEHGVVRDDCESGFKKNRLFVYDIQEISGDRLCYATSAGFYVGAGDTCHPGRIAFLDPSGRTERFMQFTHTLEDHDHTFWASTLDGGIIHFRLDDSVATVLSQMDREHGLPTNTCYAIYSDTSGNKWVSTDLGLVQLRSDLTFRVYTTEDGLPNNEFNRISHFQDEDGNIYFGGLNGVVAFSPGEMNTREQEGLTLNILTFRQYSGWQDTILDETTAIRSSHTVEFRPGDKFFEIRVGLNDLFETGNHTYEYRFPDINTDWEPMRGNMLRQNTLPYGRHTLEISGQDAKGRYADNIISLTVLAIRPLYLRWWFFMVLALGGVLILREYLLSRTRQVRKLEAMVRQRTHVIEEQAEALRQSEAARSRFFANISHELRTPLTLIKGPVKGLIKGEKSHTKEQDYLKIIEYNADLLGDRIEDLLLLAKSNSGNLVVHRIPVDFKRFLERIVDSFSGLAAERDFTMEVRNQLPAHATVLADSRKLEHILSNYISNALKYADPCTTITISAYQENDELRLSVNDQGPGIPSDILDKIFDRYYTGNSDQGGAGIGLSLSRDLAKVMGGNAWAESDPGRGSTFYVAIPYVQADAEEAEPVSESFPVPPEVHLSKPPVETNAFRILCVEDNRSMRDYIANELASYQLTTCENGVDALKQLEEMSANGDVPDCIVSDVMMPEMDGFELARQLRSSENFSSIPIILLTARAGQEDKLTGLRIGVDDYITKPFDAEELRVRINNLVERKSLKQEAISENGEQITAINHKWLQSVEELTIKRLHERDFTIDRLAIELHMSRSQFYRRIKAYTGLTPHKYLREARLYRAKELLEGGECSTIAQLSQAVGFDDPGYFSKIYAERFGYRPVERI